MVVTQVYDVVFSPKTLQLAEADKQLRKMVIDTALDGITQRFPIHKLARDNLKFPSLKFKVSGALAGTHPTRPLVSRRVPPVWMSRWGVAPINALVDTSNHDPIARCRRSTGGRGYRRSR